MEISRTLSYTEIALSGAISDKNFRRNLAKSIVQNYEKAMVGVSDSADFRRRSAILYEKIRNRTLNPELQRLPFYRYLGAIAAVYALEHCGTSLKAISLAISVLLEGSFNPSTIVQLKATVRDLVRTSKSPEQVRAETAKTLKTFGQNATDQLLAVPYVMASITSAVINEKEKSELIVAIQEMECELGWPLSNRHDLNEQPNTALRNEADRLLNQFSLNKKMHPLNSRNSLVERRNTIQAPGAQSEPSVFAYSTAVVLIIVGLLMTPLICLLHETNRAPREAELENIQKEKIQKFVNEIMRNWNYSDFNPRH